MSKITYSEEAVKSAGIDNVSPDSVVSVKVDVPMSRYRLVQENCAITLICGLDAMITMDMDEFPEKEPDTLFMGVHTWLDCDLVKKIKAQAASEGTNNTGTLNNILREYFGAKKAAGAEKE